MRGRAISELSVGIQTDSSAERVFIQTKTREPLGEVQNLDCDERRSGKRILATAMARDVPIIPLD